MTKCPTCGESMLARGGGIFWCKYCGTFMQKYVCTEPCIMTPTKIKKLRKDLHIWWKACDDINAVVFPKVAVKGAYINQYDGEKILEIIEEAIQKESENA